MKSIFKCFVLVLTFGFLTGCKHDRFDIDTSKVNVEPIVFKRLDKDVFALTSKNINEETVKLQAKYSTFYSRYISSIVNTGGVKDSLYSESLLRFINDKDMSAAYADVKKAFTDNDIELLGDEMTEVVKRYKVFFPSRKIPKQFVTFMSGFNYNVVYVDSTLGIGLEMYMGSNNPFYTALQFPKYKSRTMNKEHLLSDAVRGWLITEYDNSDAVNNLLNHMIFYGKLFYSVDALLPHVQDSIKIAYTSDQMRYCKQYEKNLWGFFAKDNKLYENDLKVVAEFTNDGPNSASSISKECPPRIAMWVGWQIVKSYMEHNEEVSMEDLMKEKDAQKILSKSKYKP